MSRRALRQRRGRRDHHRRRRHRPLDRRPGREAAAVRRPAGLHLQLRLRDAAGEPAERRPLLLPGAARRPEPARAARRQLVRRADHAQHRRRAACRPTSSRGRTSIFDLAKLRRTGRRSSTIRRRPTWTSRTCSSALPDGTIRYNGGEHVIWNGRDDATATASSRAKATTRCAATAATTSWKAAPATTSTSAATATTSSPTPSATTSSRAAPATTPSAAARASTCSRATKATTSSSAATTRRRSSAARQRRHLHRRLGRHESFGGAGDDWMEGGEPGRPARRATTTTSSRTIRTAATTSSSAAAATTTSTPRAATTSWSPARASSASKACCGFDWVTYRGEPLPVDADMLITGLLPRPPLDTNAATGSTSSRAVGLELRTTCCAATTA